MQVIRRIQRTLALLPVLCAGLLLATPASAASTCAPAGAFAGNLPCCGGTASLFGGALTTPLQKDAAGRCQYGNCKKAGEAGQLLTAEGVTNCCFGLALVAGVCRQPTLLQTRCTILGMAPTAAPCCTGLTKSTSTGKCVRNTLRHCSPTELPSCCHNREVNNCPCYCPSPYYVGTSFRPPVGEARASTQPEFVLPRGAK